MEYARAPFANRCNNKTSIRPRQLRNLCETPHNDAVESTLRCRNGLFECNSNAAWMLIGLFGGCLVG
eukprot:9530064-Lingulodinium_polyedra.AAC.1